MSSTDISADAAKEIGRKAWARGYEQAIQTFRDVAKEMDDEAGAAFVERCAVLVGMIKPLGGDNVPD